MKLIFTAILSFVLPLALIAGCSTAPRTGAAQNGLVSESDTALNEFKQADSTVDPFLKKAYGYAVFPGVGKGGVGIGGAYGHGVVYEQGKLAGFCDLSQASIGFQLGGQQFSEMIAFQTREALDNFKSNNLEFAAQASAVAVQSGAAATANYTNGVVVFTHTVGGLMAEASIGGQKFGFQPKQEQPKPAAAVAQTEQD